MLSEVFWVAFITTVSGMVIKLVSMAYKSKCTEVECCCLKIKRDIEAEVLADEIELPSTPANNASGGLTIK